jgi:hypothetical protein
LIILDSYVTCDTGPTARRDAYASVVEALGVSLGAIGVGLERARRDTVAADHAAATRPAVRTSDDGR